jgi:hypothetical protein
MTIYIVQYISVVSCVYEILIVAFVGQGHTCGGFLQKPSRGLLEWVLYFFELLIRN